MQTLPCVMKFCPGRRWNANKLACIQTSTTSHVSTPTNTTNTSTCGDQKLTETMCLWTPQMIPKAVERFKQHARMSQATDKPSDWEIGTVDITAAAPPANRNPSIFSLSIQHALRRFIYKIVGRLLLYNVVFITIHLCSLILFAALWLKFVLLRGIQLQLTVKCTIALVICLRNATPTALCILLGNDYAQWMCAINFFQHSAKCLKC